MKFYISLLYLLLPSCEAVTSSQKNEDFDFYQEVYDYINTNEFDFMLLEKLSKDCEYSSGLTSKGLIISDQVIENDGQLVLCDLLNRRYKSEKNCPQLFGTADQMLIRAQDSIRNSSRRIDSPSTGLKKFLSENTSDDNAGFVLFFSDMINNTLTVEMKSFCKSYRDINSWQGASKIFHFVFNEKAKIVDVFRGEKHYN